MNEQAIFAFKYLEKICGNDRKKKPLHARTRGKRVTFRANTVIILENQPA